MEKKVCLAWATKKRHIAIDGVVLCEAKSKSGGYSTKNGSYNSIALSGLPDYERKTEDKSHCHTDGIIPFVPLSEQPLYVNEKSICAKCAAKYQSTLTPQN